MKHKLHTDTLDLGNRLMCWSGRPMPMQRFHHHNDIELNFLERGSITYLFGGVTVMLAKGHLALFWAARPHQLTHCSGDSHMSWFVLPLARFLQWHMPKPMTDALLNGALLVEPDGGSASTDLVLMRRWEDDLSHPHVQTQERERIVQLELEARLRRLAYSVPSHQRVPTKRAKPQPRRAAANASTMNKAEKMAQFIATHFAEPLRVERIAQHVNVHPNYAMHLFREAFGMSLVDYLTEHRVAHAQRLLVTTDMSVLDVALESGFASLSRFYSAFKRVCGKTPRAYRESLQSI